MAGASFAAGWKLAGSDYWLILICSGEKTGFFRDYSRPIQLASGQLQAGSDGFTGNAWLKLAVNGIIKFLSRYFLDTNLGTSNTKKGYPKRKIRC